MSHRGCYGTAHRRGCIDVAQADEVELCTSRILLVELARILQRAKFSKAINVSGSSADELVMGYVELATLVTPMPIRPTILRDPDDDHVLACALAAQADLIVSGDADLLVLEQFQGIRIVTAAQAVRSITTA